MTWLQVISHAALDILRGTNQPGVTILIGLISNNQDISATSFFFCLHLQNKEIEELTKICDELIAKMGKS